MLDHFFELSCGSKSRCPNLVSAATTLYWPLHSGVYSNASKNSFGIKHRAGENNLGTTLENVLRYFNVIYSIVLFVDIS